MYDFETTSPCAKRKSIIAKQSAILSGAAIDFSNALAFFHKLHVATESSRDYILPIYILSASSPLDFKDNEIPACGGLSDLAMIYIFHNKESKKVDFSEFVLSG